MFVFLPQKNTVSSPENEIASLKSLDQKKEKINKCADPTKGIRVQTAPLNPVPHIASVEIPTKRMNNTGTTLFRW